MKHLCAFSRAEPTHQLSPLLGRPGLSQGVYVSTDGDLSPDSRLGFLSEASLWVHYQDTVGGESVHVSIRIFPFCCLLSKEYIFGGIESCCEYACCVWLVPVTHDSAGEPGDGALCDLGIVVLTTGNCVCDHEVDGAFC